ncbi:DNA-protecting protein DprA [Candidatus Falkowbacteria bacterium]|nr:DNA-protecting protein DprA [Candidatus Falkowbacteria bacterium]
MSDLKYWLAFSAVNKFGFQKISALRAYFPSLKEAWTAPLAELIRAGINQEFAEEFILTRKEINPDQELEKLNAEKINTITIAEERYPELLKEIYSPPFILYYKGELNNLTNQAIAVVGTRKITAYGKLVTEKIVAELVAEKMFIVSGLALGVDAAAHIACLAHNGLTAAVLGSGLDKQNIYPSVNRPLAEEIIAKGGLLVSEYSPGTLPLRHHFPTRNRVIAGLSLGVLVVEAGESSGALITARFALEQNREVFAVPGNITNQMSIGANELIKKGAKLVASAEDIFEELNIKRFDGVQKTDETIPASPEEAAILKFLRVEPLHVNELVRRSDLSIIEINAALMLLEIKGRVKNIGNMTYVLI